MSHTTRRGPVKPQMNITPLIDVVFLLIVFFMLVSKIVTEEVPELQLPDPDTTQAFRDQTENRIIVNIVPLEPIAGRVGPDRTAPDLWKTEGGDIRDGTAEFVTMGSRKWEMASTEAIVEFQAFLAKSITGRLQNPKQGRPMIFLRCDSAIFYRDAARVLQLIQNAEQDAYQATGIDPTTQPLAGQIEIIAYAPPKE
ncbi:MAG: biopolymer transporter ExbD [Planctomycetota bacterium]